MTDQEQTPIFRVLVMNGNFNELLKSLGPEHPEWLKMSTKLWAHLDELAQNDPNAYKEYIEKAKQESINSRLVKPGWGIKTFLQNGNAFTKVFINIGISERIARPPSLDLNNVSIPLILGSPRSFENSKVLDIVYHSSVIQKTFENSEYLNAILDLSWGACKETLDWDINTRHGFDIKKELYYGRYGWDDKGKPVSEAQEPVDIIYKEPNNDDEKDDSLLKPDDSMKKNLVQEVEVVKKEPIHKIINDADVIKVLVYLPNINTGSEADVQLIDSVLTVDSLTDHLKLVFSGIKSVTSAEFSKTSGILKLCILKNKNNI